MRATGNGVVIDLNTEAFVFGENRLTIEKSVPIITKQPQNVTLISGNDARFSVEAIGAVRYEWEIFDVEDETQQPYSRETVLAHCSGVNSFEESTFQIYGVSSWFLNKAVHVWIKGKDGGVTSHTAYFNIIVKPPAEVSQLKNEIVISSAAAQKFGVKVGEKLVLSDEVNERDYAFTVKDIVSFTSGVYVFLDRDVMQELFDQEDDYYNVVFADHALDIDGKSINASELKDISFEGEFVMVQGLAKRLMSLALSMSARMPNISLIN